MKEAYSSVIAINRRTLLGAAGANLLLTGPAPAAQASKRWRDYEARLRTGITTTIPNLERPMAAGLLEQNNAFRKKEGLSALADDAELALAAQAHLADMRARRFFDHNTPDGFSPSERSGLLCRSLLGVFGENIAFIEDPYRPVTAARFFENWRDSPGHRANMLKPEYTHVGHAVLRFGSRYLAAAVFGQVRARLASPLPLAVTGQQVSDAVALAKPAMNAFLLSEPMGKPEIRPNSIRRRGPALDAGVWRLRPMLPRTRTHYEVLWGPIFFVGA